MKMVHHAHMPTAACMYLQLWITSFSIFSALCVDFPVQFGFVSDELVIKTIPGVSFTDCFKECKKHLYQCSGIAFQRIANLCLVYKRSDIEPTLTKRPGFIYSKSFETQYTTADSCGSDGCGEGETCEGTSSSDSLQCVKTYCGEMYQVPYAQVFGNLNHIAARRRVVCNVGTTSGEIGTVSVECLSNGSWSLVELQCLPFEIPLTDQLMVEHFLDWPIRTVQADSRVECAIMCYEDTLLCMLFNFYEKNGTCILSLNILPDNNRSVGVGWEMAERTYPVFTTRPPGKSKNTTTFEEAVGYCKSLSTEVASRQDLELAHSLGFSKCVCGFVSDTSILISMVFTQTICVGRGINTCDWLFTKADVYCKNKRFVRPYTLEN